MSGSLSVPSELLPMFREFSRSFDWVTSTWLIAGHESEQDVDVMREGVRRYIADTADPDAHGVQRDVRLRVLFEFWNTLRGELCPHGVAVVPQLSIEAERRIADGKWKAGRR